MSSQVLIPNTESAILARILQADEQELTLDAARYWLSVKIPASDQDRVDELSAKARAGSLTEAETQELDNYLHIDFLLSTMQAKARRLLPMESADAPLAKGLHTRCHSESSIWESIRFRGSGSFLDRLCCLRPEARIPVSKGILPLFVEDTSADLEKQVGATLCPLHLLALDHALAHHLINR